MFVYVEQYAPFEISKEGVVRNKLTSNILKPSESNSGYLRVSTTYKQRRVKASVHRLVAIAFIPNPANMEYVNHIDGDKKNNHVDNLEWTTPIGNTHHAMENGLICRPCGDPNYSEDLIRSICGMLQDGRRNIDIIREYEGEGINQQLICDIKGNRSWPHISSEYDFSKHKRGSHSTISTETIHWICSMIAKGISNKEIRESSTNKRITKDHLHTIRTKRCHKAISDTYF